MRVWTPTEVLVCQAGVMLECVAGQVVHIGERKTGTNNYGPWSLQNITLADGNRLKVKLLNQGELARDAQGHKLYVISGTGKRGQSIGVVTELDTYKGQTSLVVKANENASLSWNPPAGASEPRPPQPPQQHQAAPPATQQAPPPPPQPPHTPTAENNFPPPPPPPPPIQHHQDAAPSGPAVASGPAATTSAPSDPRRAWAKVDKGLNKLRRLRLRTLSVAFAIQRDAASLGHQIASDHVEKIDSWLAIECCRNGLLVDVPDVDPPGIAPLGGTAGE